MAEHFEEEHGWLGRCIKRAQEEFDSWPKWMKEAAHFEGRDHMEDEDG